MVKAPGAARRLRLTAIYLSPEDRDKFHRATRDVGWPEKTFIQQTIHAHLARHEAFYLRAALTDYETRGMSEQAYFAALRDEGIEALAPYPGYKPQWGETPLGAVPKVPATAENRMTYNTVTLSPYRLVMLRVAQVVYSEALTQLVSRIVTDHFLTYWERQYQRQLDADEQCRFPPIIEDRK